MADSPDSAPTPSPGVEFEILVCPKCAAKNAVYLRDLDKMLKCRKCGNRFTKDEADVAKPKHTKKALTKTQNLSGRQLGHFKLLGVLGSGAMGVVYRAQDTMLMRDVAVKVLPKDISERDPKGLERFLNEARTAAQLVHPNVVQIFHIAQAEGTYFIAMEYVRGGTAERAAQLRGGRLDEIFAFEKMLEVADAMGMAHRRRIYHRDIKPANLLLTTEGMLKVADFGLALWSDSPDASSVNSAAPHIVGTPQYMSPEQARGQTGEGPSDVYSMGATFYRLVVGQPPFKASNAMGYFQAHINQPVPNPQEQVPDLDPELSELLVKCLAKKPEDRPQAQQVAQFLRDRLGNRRPGNMGSMGSLPMLNLSDSNSVLMAPNDRMPIGGFDSAGASQTFASQSNYLALFGLSYYPFNDVRNPNAFWLQGPYSSAVESLVAQIELGCSPVMLVGPPGSGRTFVSSMVQRQVQGAMSYVIQPRLLAGSRVLLALCRQANAPVDGKTDTAELIEAFLAKAIPPENPDARVLVVVDEVKSDKPDAIADIREFIHATADRPNVSVLLIGPPDLPAELTINGVPLDLRGEAEPVLLRELTAEEMNDYIDFRMQNIGRASNSLKLTPAARQLLHRRSGGVPRLINIFCHNALTLAAYSKSDEINTDLLWRATYKKSYVTNVESLPSPSERLSDVWRKPEVLRALELITV